MVAGAVLALAGTADGDLEVVGETDGSLSALGVANGDLRPVDAGEDAVDCCLLFCFLPREPRVLVPRFVMGLAARPLMENWSLNMHVLVFRFCALRNLATARASGFASTVPLTGTCCTCCCGCPCGGLG